MKRLVVFVAISLFLIGFVVADYVSTGDNPNIATSVTNTVDECLNNCPVGCAAPEYRVCASNGEKYCNVCAIKCYGLTEADSIICKNETKNETPPTTANTNGERATVISAVANKYNLTEEQVRKIVVERNVIKAVKDIKAGDCPDQCTCTGSAMKCTLANGRDLTIVAGNSGNIIVQVKGENMTTNVVLYKSDGKIYGTFKNNETREVKLLPDQVKEKIQERLARQVENENVSLNENGEYDYTATKPAKLFFIFPVKVAVQAQVDSTTGEITTLKTKWWAFLARDTSQPIVGASCGTVTPGSNDACCVNKGYNLWNATANECQFSQ